MAQLRLSVGTDIQYDSCDETSEDAQQHTAAIGDLPPGLECFDLTEADSNASCEVSEHSSGGSWHDSDEYCSDCDVGISIHHELAASQAVERHDWLLRRLSVGDLRYNQSLVEQAAARWPLAANEPVADVEWEMG